MFNTRTMGFELRGVDGNVYAVDARRSKFEAATVQGIRPAEFVDVRPGARLEVIGVRIAPGRIQAELIRITALPLRASTEDPYPIAAGPVRASVPAGGGDPVPPAPERVAMRGTVRSIDRGLGLLQMRSGQDNIQVRVTGLTQWDGIEADEPDLSHLRVGDVVIVEAVVQDGGLKAERVALERTAAKQ
jgi:hypothetical protein